MKEHNFFSFFLYFAENRHFQVGAMFYYVFVTSYVLVSMERGDCDTKQLYFGYVNFKFTGVVTTSPSPEDVTKKAQKDEG